MPTAHVNGIDIWYELEGAGPALVLTHGFAAPTSGWAPVVAELRPHFRMLLYDVRGHGRTSVPPADTFSVPQFAADLRGLLDALAIDRAHIAGVSMGGMISAQFACDYPDRVQSLLLCDTTAGNQQHADSAAGRAEAELGNVFGQLEGIVRKHGLAGLAERENRYRHEHDPYATKSSFTLDEQDERNIAHRAAMTPEGYLAAARALRERPDLTSRTPAIAEPTLVSCGEWDMFYPCAARDAALIPNARFATVRNAAHDTTTYRPQSWKRAVLDFIDDVEAERDIRGAREYTD